MKKICLTCEKEFEALQRELNRGNGKYCSRECSNNRSTWRNRSKTMAVLTCAGCAVEFERQECRVHDSKSGLNFCSRKCKDSAQSISGNCPEIRPEHYGDGKSSYRDRALRHYGAVCSRCAYSEIEQMLDVHHRDKNREHNEIENLEVLCVWCHALETRGIVAQSGERLPCTQEAVGA
jgi:hypothetical protein